MARVSCVVKNLSQSVVLNRREQQEGVEDFLPTVMGEPRHGMLERNEHVMAFERRVVRGCSFASGPFRHFMLNVVGNLEDRRRHLGSVMVLPVFGGFNQDWDQINIARQGNNAAGVFAMRSVSLENGRFQRWRGMMRHAAVRLGENDAIRFA